MARRPKPWFRKARGAWFVTLNGVPHNLGPDKKAAFDRFYDLMRQLQTRRVSSQSLAAVVDAFLDWLQRNRSPGTFNWYRYWLERLCQRYPDLRLDDLKPFHVQQWVDGYPELSRTSRRNYLRCVSGAANGPCSRDNLHPVRQGKGPLERLMLVLCPG